MHFRKKNIKFFLLFEVSAAVKMKKEEESIKILEILVLTSNMER